MKFPVIRQKAVFVAHVQSDEVRLDRLPDGRNYKRFCFFNSATWWKLFNKDIQSRELF